MPSISWCSNTQFKIPCDTCCARSIAARAHSLSASFSSQNEPDMLDQCDPSQRSRLLGLCRSMQAQRGRSLPARPRTVSACGVHTVSVLHAAAAITNPTRMCPPVPLTRQYWTVKCTSRFDSCTSGCRITRTCCWLDSGRVRPYDVGADSSTKKEVSMARNKENKKGRSLSENTGG
jgi:hypothetical protein